MSGKVTSVVLIQGDAERIASRTAILSAVGCHVRGATNWRDAQRLIEAQPPAVVIASARLLASDEWQFCRWLRASDLPCHLFLLVLADANDSAVHAQALEAGADQIASENLCATELAARLRAGTRLLAREEALRKLTKTDPLTGLATELAFRELLDKEWSRSRRYGLAMSCVSIDLDKFLAVARQGGSALANAALRRIANLLVQSGRTSDFVCRRGNDRFVALLPETDEKSAALWANRVRRRIAELNLDDVLPSLRVTCSIGVAQRLDDTLDSDELLDLADQALEVAKQTGRDRVVTMQSLAAERAPHEAFGPNMLFANVRAADRMTPLDGVLSPDTTAFDAAGQLFERGLGGLPVADADGRLVGIVSEKDLLVLQLWPEWREMPIGNVMQRNVVAYDAAAPIRAIYDFLCRVSIRSVVVTQEGRPVGMLSRRDLLRAQVNEPADSGLSGAIADQSDLAGIGDSDDAMPWFPPGCEPTVLFDATPAV